MGAEGTSTEAWVGDGARGPRSVPVFGSYEPGRHVVGVILDDGTIRVMEDAKPDGDWSSGSLSGPDWILWWDRRQFRQLAS